MKQIIQDVKGELRLVEVSPPALRNGFVLVRNAASLISTGTERMIIGDAQKGLIQRARERPELVKQVADRARRDGIIQTYRAVKERMAGGAMPLGYSCAGTVQEVGEGVAEIRMGERVACAGAGYANHAEAVAVPKNLVVKLPDEVDFEDAAFVTVGAIAIQGLRVAQIALGEKVAVVGLGLVGQITVQLLQAAGCEVIGMDVSADRAELARSLGAQDTLSEGGEVFIDASMAFSKGRGVDAVIITAATESNDPVEVAGAIAREKGRVVVVGAVGTRIPRDTYYHKELSFCISRSYGPGRYDAQYEEQGIDYPFGYVRWTEKRNMEAFVDLVARDRIDMQPLITHRFPIGEALRAYEIIQSGGGPHLGVMLRYPHQGAVPRTRVELQAGTCRRSLSPAGKIGLGMVGAGNFASSVLLPALKRMAEVRLKGLVTANGVRAKATGKRYGFEYCSTDIDDLLGDESIAAVVIATRHNLHAVQACRALKAGKGVFLEKPLAMNEEELGQVVGEAMRTKGCLVVGFNRRFAPLVEPMKEEIASQGAPLAMHYRINAGALPEDSWINDPIEGGGRIVGEVCHFIDLMTFLCGALPTTVFAQSMAAVPSCDTLNINLRFQNDSIGSISYFSNGDSSFAKEYLEIYCNQSIAILDDYRRLTLVKDGKERKIKMADQDKGHRKELQAFIRSLKMGTEAPIPLREMVGVTLATFGILSSLRTASPVQLPDVDGFMASLMEPVPSGRR